MLLCAIWKKTCASEFFKDDVFPNCTRKHILLLINNIHEKMIKNRMFRRHLRAKLRHLSIVFLAY